MKSRLLGNVVIGQGTIIFELLAGEDQSLLIGWDPLLVLNLALDGLYVVTGFDVECDRFSRKRLNKNLETHDYTTLYTDFSKPKEPPSS